MEYVIGYYYTIVTLSKVQDRRKSIPDDLYEFIGESRLPSGVYRNARCSSFRSISSDTTLNILLDDQIRFVLMTHDYSQIANLDDVVYPKNKDYLRPLAVIIDERILTGKRTKII
jgi:hypothetical protein